MTDMVEVIQQCWQTAEDHGFHAVNRTFGDTIALIHTEVSEAYESFRERGHFPDYVEVDGKPEGTLVELADIVIRVFDTAISEVGSSAEQFEAVMLHKMAYNKSRPYLHGKVI